MALIMQRVRSGDSLRNKEFNLFDSGTLTAATNQDGCAIGGLSDSGGTIVGVQARAGAAPTGTITAAVLDLHLNGTTIFTSGKIAFTASLAGSVKPTINALKDAANVKVYNGDLITLDCDSIGNSGAGSNVGVTVVVRADEPND